jgi:membrane protein implicated in regulation of membrane protease activity
MLFFGASAILVGTLKAFGLGGPVWLEWVLFSVLSVVSLLTLRGPILRRMKVREEDRADDVDSLVGEWGVALGEMESGAEGQIELRGSNWSAVNAGESTLAPGQKCQVARVDGLRLSVRGKP